MNAGTAEYADKKERTTRWYVTAVMKKDILINAKVANAGEGRKTMKKHELDYLDESNFGLALASMKFGFKACEKGKNIEQAIIDFEKLVLNGVKLK